MNGLSVMNAPKAFRPRINAEYPPHNKIIFEEWFRDNYVGCDTDRVYLDIFPTAYWVNHNYGLDLRAKQELQEYINELDKSKKYFTICQYDDGVLINWNGLDVLEFNMSKKVGFELPLLCQPHPYSFKGGKKWLASFVGSRTHPIRNELEKLRSNDEYYISFEPHSIENYCRILHESVFAFCPRGYGLNSFRISEALQYGAIPIYISDEFINCFDADFMAYGWVIRNENISKIDEYMDMFSDPLSVIRIQDNGKKYYDKYYTYDGCFNQIIKSIETEYHSRKQIGADATAA